MKKIFFLIFFFPFISIGQKGYNVREILEKSIYAMDLKYKSLEYNLSNATSYNQDNAKYRIKILYDSVYKINRLLADIKYYSSYLNNSKLDNQVVLYFDTVSQMAYQWDKKLSLLKIQLFKRAWERIEYMPSTYNYFSYIKNELNYLLHPVIPDLEVNGNNAYVDRLIDSSLLYKGLVDIHAKSHYVVEHIMTYPKSSQNYTSRYPDFKKDYYSPILAFSYYYIDTLTNIVNNVVQFSLTSDNDTIFYSNIDLIDYSVNAFSDLTFNPTDYNAQKIIQETIPTKDSCDKGGFAVKELSGKLPNINGLDINGKAFSLYKQKAKCYILDFMYANCGVCVKYALPFWEDMSKKYNNRNIQYLIVDPVDDLKTATYMAQKYNINIPIIQDKKAAENYSIYGYPSCYILDENFKILFSSIGKITSCEQKEIEEILSSYNK